MSYSLQRTSVIRGPAFIVYNTNGASNTTATFFSKDDITVSFGHTTFDISNSALGVVDKRAQQRTADVSFTPTGEITAAILAILWPYGSAQPGDSAFVAAGLGTSGTGTAPTLTVIPKSGQQYTFYGAINTKQPQLMLSSTKTQIGSVTFTVLGVEGVLWSTANSMYTAAANTYSASFPSWNVSTVHTAPYLGTYGAVAIGTGSTGVFSTRDGFTLDFNVELNPVETDQFGLFDYTIGQITATASCSSLDVTADQIAALIPLQGAGADRGASLINANNLLVDVANVGAEAGLVYATLNNATILQTGWAFGLATQRIPTLQFTTIRSIQAGSPPTLIPAYSLAIH